MKKNLISSENTDKGTSKYYMIDWEGGVSLKQSGGPIILE